MHAAFSFACAHPEQTLRWHTESNFIVVLAAHDEESLHSYWKRLGGVACRVLVHEPDLGDQATAFAALGAEAARILSALPLAGKEAQMA